jgi:hypothetical protein
MKNDEVIDAAENCTYDNYAASEEDFATIFPEAGQNIEFIGDFVDRVGEDEAGDICRRLWQRPMEKAKAMGKHGLLFYELDHKKEFYPTKRDSDLDG